MEAFEAARGPLAFPSLRGEDRRYLALVDEGSCLLRRADGVSRFKAPFALAFPAGAARLLRTSDARGFRISFARPVAAELSFSIGRDDAALLSATDPVLLRIDRTELDGFRRLFEGIIDSWERGGARDLETAMTASAGLLVRFRRLAARSHRPDRSPHAADAASIRAYLDERFKESISLEAMAADFAYSPSYLSRYFKQATGRCLFEYLNSRRIAEACALLKSTDKTVTEIAFEVGYNNLSFFNRCFRKLMDASPLEFRSRSL